MQGIPRWRIALVASALVVLGAIGAGLVFANDPSGTGSTGSTGADQGGGLDLLDLGFGGLGGPGGGPQGGLAAAPQGGTGAGVQGGLPRAGLRPGARGPLLQRVVHLEGTLDLPDKGIVQVALDHGTISAIGTDTISVLEKDGKTVTLKTEATTRVRKGGAPATLADLKSGDEVIVTSRLENGSYMAYRIVVPPARPATTSTP